MAEIAEIPSWHVRGDWFDVCKCNIPCPCYFAQTPTFGDCDGTLVWRINDGAYGDVDLAGLCVLALASFEGNIWDEATKADMAIFFDAKADERQREALQTIFGGQAGGWPGGFADLIGNLRGTEFAPIEFEVADDFSSWSAKIPGKVDARAEALVGPTSVPGKLVQVHNPAGSEVGPGSIATQGVAVMDQADGFDFKWERSGQSSKHMAFDWSGPDPT
ncbi:MAG: DUF1326 domain-containing protein [Actinomycetota bacterium]